MAEAGIKLQEACDPTKGIPDPSKIKSKKMPGHLGGGGGGWHDNAFPNYYRHMVGFGGGGGGAAGAEGGYVNQMMAQMQQMRAIYRMREVGRAQQRAARRAEVQAMRDWHWNPPAPALAAVGHPAALPRQPEARLAAAAAGATHMQADRAPPAANVPAIVPPPPPAQQLPGPPAWHVQRPYDGHRGRPPPAHQQPFQINHAPQPIHIPPPPFPQHPPHEAAAAHVDMTLHRRNQRLHQAERDGIWWI